METILFVISLTVVLHFFMIFVSISFKNEMNCPFPILHIWGWGYGNVYISTPAIMYQVYFWSTYAGLFT